MSFHEMLEILREKNKGKIVLIKVGVFYIAVENDAVLLHNKLGLKCLCYRNNTCKIGIPVNSIKKYIEKLDEIKYSYIIYDFIKENKELKVVAEKNGKLNNEKEKNINCMMCKGTGAYKNLFKVFFLLTKVT